MVAELATGLIETRWQRAERGGAERYGLGHPVDSRNVRRRWMCEKISELKGCNRWTDESGAVDLMFVAVDVGDAPILDKLTARDYRYPPTSPSPRTAQDSPPTTLRTAADRNSSGKWT